MEKRIHIFASLVILATAFLGAVAQSPAPALAPTLAPLAPGPAPAGQDCFNTLLNVSDCLTYVEARSNLKTPDKNCCPSFAGLVESTPICLCELLGGGASSFGIQLDISKALKLPTVCHVTTPPVSLCAAVGVPVNAPAPAASQASSPVGQVTPSMAPDTGSTTTPQVTPSMAPDTGSTTTPQVTPSMAPDTGSTTTPSSEGSRTVNFFFFIFVGLLSCAISNLFF